jgi:hypothetical protein
MIQRIQSVFLLLSVVLFTATYYFPFGTFDEISLHSYGALDGNGIPIPEIQHYFFAIPMSLAALFSLGAIFLYGNRQRQMAIIRFTFILFALSFVLLAFYIANAGNTMEDRSFAFGSSFFLPFISFFLNMLAVRAIKKDEQLVKSVDRIR